ncbi:MAG: hypothetical protein KGL52_15525 [Rhodospirillales bacterium]|jgi:hypothetical protein|nr:hypothetical protein [Rhodospirillales bacterium]
MLDLTRLAPGTRLRIAGDLIAEVVHNMGDGEWLRVRVLPAAGAPLPADGAEELCHATDVLELL